MDTQPFLADWRQKYDDLTVEGLTDGRNYVRLAHGEAEGQKTLLVLRPLIRRIDPTTTEVICKVSVFPDPRYADPMEDPSFPKEEDSSVEELESLQEQWDISRTKVLKASFSALFPVEEVAPKESWDRIGAEARYRVHSSDGHDSGVKEFFKTENFVSKTLDSLSEKLGGLEDRERIEQAITDSYDLQIAALFPKEAATLN